MPYRSRHHRLGPSLLTLKASFCRLKNEPLITINIRIKEKGTVFARH